MKGMLRYRMVEGKESYKVRIFVLIVIFATICAALLAYYSRDPSDDYHSYYPFPLKGYVFASAIHHLLIFMHPTFSFFLGIFFSNWFLTSDFQSGRFRMIAIAGQGKKQFYRMNSFLGIGIGLLFTMFLWLLLFLMTIPLWSTSFCDMVNDTCVSALLLSFLLFLIGFYGATLLALLLRDSFLGEGILILTFAIFWIVATNITNASATPHEKIPPIICWIPLGGWAHLARYPFQASMWVPFLGGIPFLFALSSLSELVYEKTEA